MVLNRRQQNALRDFLLKPGKLVYTPSDGLARYLSDNYGDLLKWRGKQLIFSEQSKQKLKQELHLHQPDLFFISTATQNRVAFAGVSGAEKQARLAPEDTHVLVNHHQGNYACIGLNAPLPKGTSLRVPLAQLQQTSINKIVVIENLDIFDHWYEAMWAGRDENTLAVYRGHDKSQSGGVSSLLECYATKARIIAFCDYDPKGAEIALTTTHIQSLLLPDLTTINPQAFYKINQPHLYQKQARSVGFLRSNVFSSTHAKLQALCNEANMVAVLQQHMLAYAIPLQEIYL
ncbi:hypothetical protein CA267_003160 [Alteromonas pelagimontana]|uniref:DUF7281 domain-containing protein n=1 Tax=Alteromonas pelagimontana TaxID=1858656 RepID=A0A6M4M9M8_9ALTE|nr:hypothetical protein [Alteromonas pelagimontana]QJR79852.1 hypothetical protein CA267_003160 [Alteromonas pelagimontana]